MAGMIISGVTFGLANRDQSVKEQESRWILYRREASEKRAIIGCQCLEPEAWHHVDRLRVVRYGDMDLFCIDRRYYILCDPFGCGCSCLNLFYGFVSP